MTNLLFAPPALGTVLSLTGLPGGSNKIHDKSPYDNIGTITGATWKVLPSGLWYLSYDGGDDYVDLNAASFLYLPSGFTFKSWIRLLSSGVDVIVSKWHNITPLRMWHVQALGLKIYFSVKDESINGQRGRYYDTALTQDVWYHLVCTYDGGTVSSSCKIFLNGIQVDDNNDSGGDFVAIEDLAVNGFIGKNAEGNLLHADMALISIYNRALSSLEIQNHFNREKRLFGVW